MLTKYEHDYFLETQTFRKEEFIIVASEPEGRGGRPSSSSLHKRQRDVSWEVVGEG